MKTKILLLNLLLLLGFIGMTQELSPFQGVTIEGNIDLLASDIEAKLLEANFDIVGKYQVAGHTDLQVLCFSREDLKKVCEEFEDRGALASVLKIGLKQSDGKVELSILQPSYMFHAYFGENYQKQESVLKAIDTDAKEILSSNYGKLTDFGGYLEIEELQKYHYKVMMPYFDDPVELEEFNSFEEGLKYIRRQISDSGADIKLVYEVSNKNKKTAVFGIGLLHAETGEGNFLPIIGERHIAAMPYEIILQGNTASMLHGKYRFALYWPELTMGTFMKIMSTPGDVEDLMESITEKQ